MRTYLHIGGVSAVGFEASGAYLLVMSHSGRGVFSTKTWERVARDYALAYPENGVGIGIGPVAGQATPVTEMNFDTADTIPLTSPDGRTRLVCESSGIAVEVAEAQ